MTKLNWQKSKRLVTGKKFILFAVSFLLSATLSFSAFYYFNPSSDSYQDSLDLKNEYEITIERQDPASGLAQETPAAVNTAKKSGNEDYFSVIVRKGHTFNDALAEAGIDKMEARQIRESVKHVLDLNSLNAGQEIMVAFDEDKNNLRNGSDIKLASLKIPAPERDIEVMRDTKGNFVTKETQKKLVQKIVKASTKIKGSLFQSGMNAGVSPNIMLEVIKAFSYDVDFQRDIKSGDRFEVLYNAVYNQSGHKVREGKVIYASLISKGKELKIYRHTNKSGESDYFTADGQSVRKSLLKTPINGARITSGFGFRMHPLLGYSKMHRGIDFGAATGTPIFASGNGVVAEMGPKNGYGNYLKLRHNADYASAYAHISRFASGIYIGKKVTQGQIIAYVGSTGMATGPHLHYEIIYRGEQVNPLAVKSTPGVKLSGRELAAFQKNTKAVDSMLASLPVGSTQIASK